MLLRRPLRRRTNRFVTLLHLCIVSPSLADVLTLSCSEDEAEIVQITVPASAEAQKEEEEPGPPEPFEYTEA